MKTISLKHGDSLNILPETKDFRLQCCKCGLIHLIKVKRKKDNIMLQFLEDEVKENGNISIWDY